MKFTHRIKGTVTNSFILRGLLCEVNRLVEICVNENELDFVKNRMVNAKIEVINKGEKKAVPTETRNSTTTIPQYKEAIKPKNKPTNMQ